MELTELGQEQAHKHTEEILDNITQMLSVLNEEDAREYVRITSILAKHMEGCGK